MKFFLSLSLFGLSWLGSIFPNTETSTLPQWEQQAIKYGEGDPELECLYREILFSIHQREEQQRNRINLLMHLEVLPHAELHARKRILNGLMEAEHEHQSDKQQIQTDTIKNDQNRKKLEKDKEEKLRKGVNCGMGHTSIIEGFCAGIKNFRKIGDSIVDEKAKERVLSSLDNAACISEKDIRDGKRKELLQKFWNENQEKLYCAIDVDTQHVLTLMIENKSLNFLDYLIKENEIDFTINLALANPIDKNKTPYNIIDYLDIKISEETLKLKNDTNPDQKMTIEARIKTYDVFLKHFEKLFQSKYPGKELRLRRG